MQAYGLLKDLRCKRDGQRKGLDVRRELVCMAQSNKEGYVKRLRYISGDLRTYEEKGVEVEWEVLRTRVGCRRVQGSVVVRGVEKERAEASSSFSVLFSSIIGRWRYAYRYA
jgi:hypothetical protein